MKSTEVKRITNQRPENIFSRECESSARLSLVELSGQREST